MAPHLEPIQARPGADRLKFGSDGRAGCARQSGEIIVREEGIRNDEQKYRVAVEKISAGPLLAPIQIGWLAVCKLATNTRTSARNIPGNTIFELHA